MINKTEKSRSNEVRNALNSVKKMESAGLRRAIPPWWFGLTMALATGVIFVMASMEVSRLHMLPIFLLIIFCVIYQTRKTGVIVRSPFSRRTHVLLLISVVAIFVLLVFVARELRDTFGFLAPVSLGVLITVFGLIAFAFERRGFLTKIKAEKLNE